MPARPRRPRGQNEISSPASSDRSRLSPHLQRLEDEAIHILREVVAEFRKPVMLYSVGKDSSVMLHLARKAFFPAPPPFPFLHIATGWDFRALLEHRDRMAREYGLELLVHGNDEAARAGINPFDTETGEYSRLMLTEALRAALDQHGFDAAIGGGRRDEEKARAKERIFSHRSAGHVWDPRNQRPELWRLFNTRLAPGETMRVFPLSNWTELDVWTYIQAEAIPIVPLYFAAERPVVARGGALIAVDDERMPLPARREAAKTRRVRFRTLGCWPLTGAVESQAADVAAVIAELRVARSSERQGRLVEARAAGFDGAQEARGLLLMPDASLPADDAPAAPVAASLRFLACGSVDDGKSTLIGRLIADASGLFEDQIKALQEDSRRFGTTGDEHRLRPAARRAGGRARAGHHHRRRLPLLRDARGAPSSSPTRRAISSTPATWRPAPPTPSSPCCWSMRARGCWSRRAGTPRSCRCSASATSCWR